MMRDRQSLESKVAIVGASTLKGQEVKSVLSERGFPVAKLVLMDSDEDLGRLSEFEGEPAISLAITEESFAFLDLVFFAGNPASTRRFAPLAQRNHFLAIDLSNAFFDDPQVPLLIRSDEFSESFLKPPKEIVSSPHPAALTVATVLKRLSLSCRFHHCVINVFEPASEYGSPGVEELEKQTLNIFSFQPSPQMVFDRQLAFNLLSRLGEASKGKLFETETVITSELQVLLKGICPVPALTLIQAPVFHTHCFSIFLELETIPKLDQIENSIRSEFVEVTPAGDEPPSPVQVAGTDLIHLGGLKRDFANPKGIWFWAVADNLRLSALNSVAVAERMILRKKL
jgi:aspartate-semialdehyde dehydrogenase